MRSLHALRPFLVPASTAALAAACLAPGARAQQFVNQTGWLPTATRWTEGVECADVDNDGDLDVFFADGDGFSSAGTQRQNTLVINKLLETGVGVFADESVARLGANLSNAKGVTTGDVDGDGWVDALFANAFNTDTPFLYINRGAAQPGYFDMESSSRGLTTNLSSAGAQFGDLDDDGDLDIVICDSGASFFGGAGGRPRLYKNDGAGNFTEDAAAMNAPLKRAHMDVQLVDIDGDFDLDFFGVNRATNGGGDHYLMLNDGSANFSDSSSLMPGGSGASYEAEVGDFDGDTDLDAFFVSLSGFREGAVRNDLVGLGSLGFTALPPLSIQNDDNEIVLLDYDNDGDQDPFVGSLGNREELWRNDGGLNFTLATPGSLTFISDPTLDMTAADLDNDGDYDLITAQGEGFPQSTYQNKVYRNTGGVDVRPPVVTGIDAPNFAPAAGPTIVRVKATDAVMDDSVTYVTGVARWVVNTSVQTAAVTVDGSGFAPAVLNIAAGTTVTWTHGGGGAQSVTSTTAPYDYDSGSFSSGSYSYTFVAPGTYDYTSVPGGVNGQVVVTGTAQEADGLYAGGTIHRFELTDTAGGAGVELCWEVEIVDWPGNARIVPGACVALCRADNVCVTSPNSVGPGAVMSMSGSLSLAADDLTLISSGCPPGALGIFFVGTAQTQTPFGNGFLCVAAPVTRLGSATAFGGTAMRTVSNAQFPPTVPGDERYFQHWYRNPAGGGAGFNLSDSLRVRFCE